MGVRRLSGLLACAAVAALLVPGEAQAQPVLATSERGLSEPVPPTVADVGALNIQEATDLAAELNGLFPPGCQWTSSGTAVTAVLPFQASTCFPGLVAGTFFAASQIDHRVFMTEVASLIDNRDSTSSGVELSGVLANGAPITLGGETIVDTRPRLLRAARGADGRRYFAGPEVQTGGGPVVVTDRVLSELVTGRDTYATAVSQIGPGTATAGTRVNCPAAASTAGCVGGITVEAPAGTQLFVGEIYTTLFITTAVERTLTGGTTLYDVALTPLPAGAVHAASANAGFLVTDRFLHRLTDGPGDAAPGRGGSWSEAWGSQSEFDGAGVLGPTDIDSFGFAGGVVARPSDDWTLGLAGEYGETDLAIADALTPEAADAWHLKIGAHASFAQGRYHAGIAAVAGAFDIGTTGASGLGAASANYDATISGAALEAGYDVPLGVLTLTPGIGVSALGWRRGGFAEAGGPAPLSVAAGNETQARAWAGLNARWAPDAGKSRLAVNGYARAVTIAGDTVAHVTAFDPQLPGEAFVATGPDFGDSAAELGVALAYRLGERASIQAGYDGRFSSGYDAHGGSIGLNIRW